MEKSENYRCYQDIVFWHQGTFQVSVACSSGKVAVGLFNEKYRLEKLFATIDFHGTEKVAIGFGDNCFEWMARLVIWCNDEFLSKGERWIPCHPGSPLAIEESPEWIRTFCINLNELFENNPNIKRYVKNIDFDPEFAIDDDCQRLNRFVAQHQNQ